MNDVRQSRDGAQYMRQQTGHSVTRHVIAGILTCGLTLPWTIYYAKSPNHFFHS